MASLKDINATIEEGNEDLEKLNRNFNKWFESQKKGGDDLETAAEARTKKGKGGIIKAAATGAAVSKIAEKDGLSKYLKFALPLMLPLAWPFISKFMNEKRFDINGDGEPDLSLTNVGVGAAALYGANKFSNLGKSIGDRLARAREIKLNLKNTAAFNQRLKVLELQIKADKAAAAADDLRLRQAKIDRLLAQKNKIGLGSKSSNLFGNQKVPTGGTVTGLNNARNSSIRIPTAANTNIPPPANTNTPVTNTKARSASKFKNFLNRTTSLSQGGFNSIKQGMSKITSTGSKVVKGVMPTLQNYGKNTKAYIRALASWAQTMNPGATAKRVGKLIFQILGGAFKFVMPAVLPVALALSIGAWAKVMYGQPEGGGSYTQNEKIAATGRFIGGWVGLGIGTAIGLAIASVPGAIIGSIFGAMSGAELGSILFAWGANKSRKMQMLIDHKKAVLMGEGVFQSDPAFARIGGLDTQGRNMFQAFAGSDNVIRRDDFGSAVPFIPTTAGTLINNMQANADTIDGYTAMAASKSKARKFVSNGLDYRNVFLGGGDRMSSDTNITPDFVRGISGGGFSTAPTADSIQMLGTAGMQARRDAAARGALMNGPEAGRDNVSSFVDAKSTNVTTVVAGGNGIKTIDTEMARRMHSYQMIGGIVSGQRAY